MISSQSDVNHSTISPQENLLLAKLRNKPFWLWDSIAHKEKNRIGRGHCCFNHIIGLPRKDGIEKPFYDYEKMLYLALLQPDYLNSITGHPGPAYKFKLKHLWVKKATGLGVIEFMLRFMSWIKFVQTKKERLTTMTTKEDNNSGKEFKEHDYDKDKKSRISAISSNVIPESLS